MECQHFDYGELVDEFRRHSTEWITARRAEFVGDQRRLHVKELAATAVLDERGAFDEALAATDGVSARSVRETLKTARALEGLPEVAAAAAAGTLSTEQLTPLVRLADAGSDAEWARRAPNYSPQDLAREARTKTKPTAETPTLGGKRASSPCGGRATRGCSPFGDGCPISTGSCSSR